MGYTTNIQIEQPLLVTIIPKIIHHIINSRSPRWMTTKPFWNIVWRKKSTSKFNFFLSDICNSIWEPINHLLHLRMPAKDTREASDTLHPCKIKLIRNHA